MQAIVCVDKNWGIGKNGDLAIHLKKDMERFRAITEGKSVVMGRKTFESIPNHPLKNRLNIVLSSNPSYMVGAPMTDFARGKVFVANDDEFQKNFNVERNYDLWLIGGAQTYTRWVDACTQAYVTRVLNDLDCDCFFPDLSKEEDWKLDEVSEVMEENGVQFVFERWTNYLAIEFIMGW